MERYAKLFLASVVALATLALGHSAGASLVFPDGLRRATNDERLADCDPGFAGRVLAVIQELEHLGFKPKIVDSWRSPLAQRKAVASGRSLVTFGFHNIVGTRREPRAFAVDLVQSDRAIPALNYVFRLSTIAARFHLDTGLLWGLTKAERLTVTRAMARPRSTAIKIGWDPCHLQPADMTVAEALEAAAATEVTQSFEAGEALRGESAASGITRQTAEHP